MVLFSLASNNFSKLLIQNYLKKHFHHKFPFFLGNANGFTRPPLSLKAVCTCGSKGHGYLHDVAMQYIDILGYFARSNAFSRRLIHKKKFSLVWQYLYYFSRKPFLWFQKKFIKFLGSKYLFWELVVACLFKKWFFSRLLPFYFKIVI